ncbi:dTDP-4-dehydrorhamnose reductase [Noviherbaspirillum agri]
MQMKILLLGRDGQVGWELQRSLAPLGELVTAGRQQADLSRPDTLRALVRDIQPSVIVNAAAYTAVDKAESELELARRVNAESVGVLAEEVHRLGAWLVHYSTDYVFDGTKDSLYTEDDATNPLSAYGRTKLEGEQLVRSAQAKHLIFRTSWVYAARGSNFAKTMLRLAKEREELKVVADQYGAPTSAELIADVTALALYRIHACGDKSDSLSGTYHLAASGETTWHQYAHYVLELAQAKGAHLKVAPAAIQPIPSSAYPLPAERPKNSRLSTAKLANTFGVDLPDWRYHVARLLTEITL